jgi:hypothetical protein
VRRFAPFVVLGYRFLGDRPSLRLHDVFAGSVGAQWLFTDTIEIIPFASYRFRTHYLLSTYVSAGLAAGSPDVGIGLEAGYGF